MYSLIILGASAFLLAFLLTPLVRNLSVSRGWVDAPDASRKLHHVAIPRTGGVAVLLSFIGAFAIFIPLGLRALPRLDLDIAFQLGPAVFVIFVTGLIDDIVTLKPWQKLIGQLLAASVAFFSGIQFYSIGGAELPGWLQLPATLLWLVMVTNAMNLIDGMDGLATGVALFATFTMLAAGLQNKNLALAMAIAPLAGALLGFLRYNFNPATIFLGDCGSLTIGFLLACFGVLWSQKSATVLGVTAPLLALAIPLMDSGLAVVRRFLRRQSIFDADRGHVHHRLLDRGLSVRQAALLLYGVSLLFAILSLMSSMLRDSYAGVVLVLFGAVTWIGVQSLGYVEINLAGRLLLGGGFRRMLVGQLVVRNFEVALHLAASPASVWAAVCETARELGFECVEMQLGSDRFHVRWREADAASEWTASVPLAGSDYVRLTRPFDTSTHQAAMGPFLDSLRKELMKKDLKSDKALRSRAAGV